MMFRQHMRPSIEQIIGQDVIDEQRRETERQLDADNQRQRYREAERMREAEARADDQFLDDTDKFIASRRRPSVDERLAQALGVPVDQIDGELQRVSTAAWDARRAEDERAAAQAEQ